MFVLEQIVSKTSKVACAIGFRHIGYLYHYSENIQNLEIETEGLEVMLSRFNEMVERALHNAQVIEPDVEKWQNDAEKMLGEVATFLGDKVRSNTRCVKCWCPNPMWRYRLGKESKLKTSRVTSLKEQGIKYLPVQLPLAHPAPPPESPLTNYEDFDSRQEIFKRILEALNNPTINMIGVHGAGGVGKTRMVNKVCNQAKRDGLFDDVAFAVVSQNLDKKNVQGELAEQLGLTLDDHGRAERLLTRLQDGKKNLVILDDVWNPLDLEEIGIPIATDYGNKEGCCKVLVTSRKNLFHMMAPKAQNKEFFIPVLEKKEARTLFMKTAEISVNSHEEMPSEAKEVCDECGGLPVAILVAAKALKGKGSYAWKDALRQLKSSNFNKILDIDPKLFPSLKLSYDHLEPKDARSCFQLCSLFPEDANISIDDLVRYTFGMRLLDPRLSTTLEDVRNRVLTFVEGLKASCLLLDGEDVNTVKMHNVIRDVAISIAKDEKGYLVKHDLKKWPEGGTYEGYSAISLMSEYFREIPREMGCKNLHTLVLRSKDSSLTDNFFNGMETNLEVLDLSGTAIETLPLSLSKLVKLRMLFLPKGLRNISLLGELKSLEILRLDGMDELAPMIRQLTCLKLLDLGNNKDVKMRVIPPNVLSNLTRMEELCIPDYFAEWQDEATNVERRNASLVELNSLTCLTTLKVHIPQGKSSPNHLCFENLVRFRISIGEHFYDFEEQESSTSMLKLSSVPLEDKFKVLLLKSEVLYLRKVTCDGGEDHLGTPEQFLQTPQPSMSRPFCNLSTLDVQNCTFKYLFNLSVARRLEQLQRLVVQNCSNMEVIVGNKSQGEDEQIIFPRLKKIYLSGLQNLKSFCPSKRPNSITGVSNSDPSQPLFCEKVILPVLEVLEVDRLGNIVEIWDKQSPWLNEHTVSFGKLRDVKVQRCEKLMKMVPSNILPRLDKLQKLCVEGCPKIESVVFKNEKEGTAADDSAMIIPQLQYLRISDMEKLKSFYSSSRASNAQSLFNHQVILPVLEVFEVDRLGNIVEIWDKQSPWLNQNTVSWGKLRDVKVQRCEKLTNLVPSNILPRLQHLQKLCVEGCPKIESIFFENEKEEEAADDSALIIPQLRYLRISDMENLKSFYSSSTASNAQSLFNHKVTFPILEKLELEGCASLRNIFHPYMVTVVENLGELIINDCLKMEVVIDEEEGVQDGQQRERYRTLFPRLSRLELRRLPALRMFCPFTRPLELPLLSKMIIYECRNMDSFSLGRVSAPNLSLKGISRKG